MILATIIRPNIKVITDGRHSFLFCDFSPVFDELDETFAVFLAVIKQQVVVKKRLRNCAVKLSPSKNFDA